MVQRILTLFAVVFFALPTDLAAQSRSDFDTIAKVNNGVVTRFELEQRVLMMEILGRGGQRYDDALDDLIDERLYQQAAKAQGVVVTQAEIDAGMDEFAARGEISGAEMVSIFQEQGIEEISFRKFVEAGLLWRKVVQTRFARQSLVSDDEIDASLNLGTDQTQLSLLASEIVLPFSERGEFETRQLAEQLSASIKNSDDFAAAARRYSSSPSAQDGGRIEWTPFNRISPIITTQLLAVDPGEITPPVELPNYIGIFQLRGIRTERVAQPLPVTLNYLRVALPQGADAQALIDGADTCLDMMAVAEKFSPVEETTLASQTPAAIRAQLDKLDRNEAIAFDTGTGQSVLMLCNRIRDLPEESREGLRQALINQRISGYGDSYLQELKGQAFIVTN